MLRGELYIASDAALARDHERAQALLEQFNQTPHSAHGPRAAILRELLGAVGDDVVVKPPFRSDYGVHISIGANTSVNYDCIVLDVAPVTIGESCQLAPRVQLLTATHPLDPAARRLGWERGEGIILEDNVWLGGGTIVCPGVTVGRDTVVGAGAVVVRDLPPGIVAVGNPARAVREITDADRVTIPG